MIIYFDSSVLVAYYTSEERSGDAKSIIDRASQAAISDICIAELSVVILRKQRDQFLSEAAATAVLELFDRHVRDIFVRTRLDEALLGATRSIAKNAAVPVRTLDALHLASAIHAGGAIATFDERLAIAARSMDVKVLS
ncbi:MAG: type II toxin-antitoxin system VapC family toxin [Acidobacteriota bacterium]